MPAETSTYETDTYETDTYETDTYAWAMAQAAALRRAAALRLNDIGLDYENLAEEIEEFGKSQARAVRSALKVIAEHLAKLEHSPAAEPRRGWRDSVIEHRQRLDDALDESPSLKARLPELAAKAWRGAREKAANGLAGDGVAASDLPEACPYPLDRLRARDWYPANRHGLTD